MPFDRMWRRDQFYRNGVNLSRDHPRRRYFYRFGFVLMSSSDLLIEISFQELQTEKKSKLFTSGEEFFLTSSGTKLTTVEFFLFTNYVRDKSGRAIPTFLKSRVGSRFAIPIPIPICQKVGEPIPIPIPICQKAQDGHPELLKLSRQFGKSRGKSGKVGLNLDFSRFSA